jgi:hypothetical protein
LKRKPRIRPGDRHQIIYRRVCGGGAPSPGRQALLSISLRPIDNVVTHAAEGVQRACRPSLFGGQQPRRKVKRAAVDGRNRFTLFISLF